MQHENEILMSQIHKRSNEEYEDEFGFRLDQSHSGVESYNSCDYDTTLLKAAA
jgi:hypothetical protein